MIVWLASYPRSGNTLFRILLHHLYGASTYSGFRSGDDLSFVGAGALTGHGKLPAELRQALTTGDRTALRPYLDSRETFFIKSHMTAGETVVSELPTILCVRDARDTLVSFTWYHLKVRVSRARDEPLLQVLLRPHRNALNLRLRYLGLLSFLGMDDKLFQARLHALVEDSRWSLLNESWLDRPQGGPVALVRFEDLVAQPLETVNTALAKVGFAEQPIGHDFPSFDELQRIYPAFFREGKAGAGRRCFSPDLHERLWSVHGPMMQRLGYQKD